MNILGAIRVILDTCITFSVPCHTLSRQSAPRHPDDEGLGGNLNTCALGILIRTRSTTSSCGMVPWGAAD